MQCVENCNATDPSERKAFEQPVWQTAQMFIGEMACWLVVAGSALYQRLRGSKTSDGDYERTNTSHSSESAIIIDNDDDDDETSRINPAAQPLLPPRSTNPANTKPKEPLHGHRILLLALPALCDICGTTLMNVGLLFVAASIYQMTRGALVLFVGLFSRIFLRRRLSVSKWMALFVVVAGVAIVGVAGATEQHDGAIPGGDDKGAAGVGALYTTTRRLLARTIAAGTSPADNTDALNALIGILLIFTAQLFTATQFVLEESIMLHHPLSALQVVGYEGTFGLALTLLLMGVSHLLYGRYPSGRGGYFDIPAGWDQIISNPSIYISSLLIMLSIGGFNFFGLSVTRTVSATSRSTIDTCRTLFIWVVSLGLGWEGFKWAQLVGFAALVYGTFLFNEVVRAPGVGWVRRWVGGRERVGELVPGSGVGS